jgi:hypothetical protein
MGKKELALIEVEAQIETFRQTATRRLNKDANDPLGRQAAVTVIRLCQERRKIQNWG